MNKVDILDGFAHPGSTLMLMLIRIYKDGLNLTILMLTRKMLILMLIADCAEPGRVEAATKEAERGSNCPSLRDQESRRSGTGERGAEKIVSNHIPTISRMRMRMKSRMMRRMKSRRWAGC